MVVIVKAELRTNSQSVSCMITFGLVFKSTLFLQELIISVCVALSIFDFQ